MKTIIRMALKTLIFFGLLAVVLGFTVPEGQFNSPAGEPEWAYGKQVPVEDKVVLVRVARSPQGRFSANARHSNKFGTSAGIDYVRPINKNWDAYAGASRNFRMNDNSGHAGLRFKF